MEKLVISIQKKIKLKPYLIPYTKNHSRYIKDLPIRPEIIKFLEENIKNPDTGPKVQTTKINIGDTTSN